MARTPKDDPTAAEINPMTDDDGTPKTDPTPTPTDQATQQQVAAATAADVADKTADQAPPPPTDVHAGSDGGPQIAGPSPTPETAGTDLGEAELEERDHSKGCPATRTEAYPATAPDGTQLKVSHCLECGATATREI